MAYESNAITEQDRASAYWVVWAGFAATPFAIAARVLQIDHFLTAPIFGLAIGGLLVSVLGRGQDDYFKSLCAMGHRFMAAFLALYLFVMFVIELSDVAYSLGSSLTSDGEAERTINGGFAYLIDGPLIAMASMLFYYCGFAYERLRG